MKLYSLFRRSINIRCKNVCEKLGYDSYNCPQNQHIIMTSNNHLDPDSTDNDMDVGNNDHNMGNYMENMNKQKDKDEGKSLKE